MWGWIMIRSIIGLFTVLASISNMERFGSLAIGIVGCAIGLGIFAWPVVAGYYKVAPEAHYTRKDG